MSKSSAIIPGTPFTIDWLVEKITPNQSILPINNQLIDWQVSSPCAGDGFLSRITAVDMNWADKSSNLPDKIIIKLPTHELIPGTDEQDEMAGLIPSLHSTECAFYDLFRHSSLPYLPKTYFLHRIGQDKEPGVIVMQNLAQNSIHGKVGLGLSLEQMFSVAECLAELHAESLKIDGKIDINWRHKLPGYDSQKIPILSICVDYWHAIQKMAPQALKGVESKLPSVFKNIVVKGSSNWLQFVNTAAHMLDQPTVLCHGDLWMDNMMFQADRPDILKGIIDWQFAHQGCACEDLTVLIAESLSAADRRKHTPAIFQRYLDRLAGLMGADKVPFTLNQLLRANEYLMPHVLLFWVSAAVMVISTDKVTDKNQKMYIFENIKQFIEDFQKVHKGTSDLWEKFDDAQKAKGNEAKI